MVYNYTHCDKYDHNICYGNCYTICNVYCIYCGKYYRSVYNACSVYNVDSDKALYTIITIKNKNINKNKK
jgi:hypothetical protein